MNNIVFSSEELAEMAAQLSKSYSKNQIIIFDEGLGETKE
jgi:hypothetical protein